MARTPPWQAVTCAGHTGHAVGLAGTGLDRLLVFMKDPDQPPNSPLKRIAYV